MKLPLPAPTGTRYVENDKTARGHSPDGKPLSPPAPNDWSDLHLDGSPIADGSHGFYEAMAGVYLSFKRELVLLDRFESGAFDELTFVDEFGEMSPHILFTKTEATQIRRELEHVLNSIDLEFQLLKTNIGQQQVNNPEYGRIPSENPYSDRVHLMGQALRNLAISTLQHPDRGNRLLNLFITADEREADNVNAVSKIIEGMGSNQLRDLRSYANNAHVDWEERGRYVARHALAETIRTFRKKGVYPFEVELMAQLCNVFIYVYDRADVDTDDVRHADLKYIRASNFIQFGTNDTPVLRVSIGEHVTGPANGVQYSYCAIGRSKTQGKRYKRTVNQRNVVQVLKNPQAVVKRANEDGVQKTQEQIDAESAKQLSDIAAVRTRAFRYQLQIWGGREDLEIQRELQEQVGLNVMIRMNTWSSDEDDVEEGEVGGGAIVPRKKPASGGAGGAVADAMRRSNKAARQAARQAAAKSAGLANEVVKDSMARRLAKQKAEEQAKVDRKEEEEMLEAKRMLLQQTNIKVKKFLDKRVRQRLPSEAEEQTQAWKWDDLKLRSREKGTYEAAQEMMEEYAAKMDEEMFERVRHYYAKKEQFEAEQEAWSRRHLGARSQRYVNDPKFAMREFDPLPNYLQRWERVRVEQERHFTHGSIWLYYNGEWFLGKQGPRDLWSNSKPTQSWTKVANNIAHILWLRYTGRVLPDYKRLIPERSAEEEVALRRQRAVNKNAMRGHMHRPNLPGNGGRAAETPEEMDEVRELRCQAFEWLYTSANIFQDPRLTYTKTQYTVDEREALQVEYNDFMSAERKHLMNILKDCTTDATRGQLNRRYEEDSRSFTVCDDPSTTPALPEGDGDAREERRLAGPTAAQKKAKYLGERESRKPLLDDPFRGEQRVWSTGLQVEFDVPVGETPRERTRRQQEHAAREVAEMALWEHPAFPSDVAAKATFEAVMKTFKGLTLAQKNKQEKNETELFEKIAKVGFPARGGLQPCTYGRMPGDTEPGYHEAMLRWWRFEKELSADGRTKTDFAWHPFLDADPLMGFAGFETKREKKSDERDETWKPPTDLVGVEVPSVEAWKRKWGDDAEAALLLKVLREYLYEALKRDKNFDSGPGVPNGWIGSFYKTFNVMEKQKDPEIRAAEWSTIQAFVNQCNLLPIVKAFRTALLALFPEPTGTTGLNGIMEFVNWFHLAAWPSDGSMPIQNDARFDVRQLDPLCQILCLPMISTWTGFEKRPTGDFFEEHKTHERVLSELKQLFTRIMFVRRALDYAASSHAKQAGGVLHKPENAKVLEHWQKLTVPVGVEDDYVSPEAAQEAQRKKYANAAKANAPMEISSDDDDDEDEDGEDGEDGEDDAPGP